MRIFRCIIAIIALYIVGICLSEVKGLPEDNIGVIDNLVTKDTDEAINLKSPDEQHSRVRRSTGFSAAESQAILDKHNDLRSQVSPEASDMQFMTWDDDLATIAQKWSDRCNWDHGLTTNNSQYGVVGQNMYMRGVGHIYYRDSHRLDGVYATQRWYSERERYNYETNQCQKRFTCGHYTQLVWANSNAVGCGISFCSKTYGGFSNAWIMTCNYGPAGNIADQRPYTSGRSCTECPSGTWQCYNNQCQSCSVNKDNKETCTCKTQCKNCGKLDSESCRCSCRKGYEGDDCSRKINCEDKFSACEVYAKYPNACDYYRELCPKSCRKCEEPDTNIVCDESRTVE